MDFRLTYEGELMARGGGADHKHEVRKVFHKQLKRLWDVHPILKHWSSPGTSPNMGYSPISQEWTAGGPSKRDYLADKFRIGDYRFVPMATEDQGLVVSLNILFLRSGAPGEILRSADLDGRLKTLIDALRMPTQVNELGLKYQSPGRDEEPFFCLMQDDKLVGNVSVTTDLLLKPSPASHGFHDTHDARVVVAVSLRQYATSGGLGVYWV